ncbi:MAG: CCE_0567 family metalloprotein [Sandaracinaceae bacterium]|nr:CCE_0567 family metalloprotein [Sandaracinaceae bacterium]
MSTSTATKADLHDLVEELPEEKVETARRFLEALRASGPARNFIARFIESMDPREAALLDELAELDRDSGPPPFAGDDADTRR